jgi:hypothetical protein
VPRLRIHNHGLERIPGKHLVFVSIRAQPSLYIDEWVFNGADIASSKIVFSRMIDPDSDLRLSGKLDDRHVWIADADTGTLQPVERNSEITRLK